ncbi:probable cytochrome P450 49a1 [Ptychodera flava]|uniref:probable cytochrome P450 49a1 n=1 Tax=Ptychodera flava TaxID=63121 RepID=UPI003969D994
MHSGTGPGRILLPVFRRNALGRYSAKHGRSTVASLAVDIDGKDAKHEDFSQPRPFEEIPKPRFLPIVGTLLDYTALGPYSIEKMLDACVDRYRKFGKIWIESFGTKATVNIIDPADVEVMFKHDGRMPERPSLEPLVKAREMYKRSIGVANLQGKEWRRIRSGVQSFVMRPKSVAQYIPDLDDVSKDFIALMKELRNEDGEIPDFQNEIYKWALESVSKVTLDTRLGCLERNLDPQSEAQQMIDATGDFFVYLGKLVFSFPLYKFISTPSWRTFLRSQDTFFRITQRHVDKTIARVRALEDKDELGSEASLLVSLLGRKELTYQDMIIMPIELIMGGIDTTSHTLVFNLYKLATNPDKQEKLHEEIMSVVPSSGEITADALQKMVYLKGCIKETFRQYPIALGTARIINTDMVLSGYNVPAGTMVRYNAIAGILEEYFPEPDKFIPERWIRGHEMQTNVSPFCILPFGHGPRMCLGRRVAEQELQIILAKLVQNFRIEWNHGEMGMKMRLVHAPDQPARFTFIDRS